MKEVALALFSVVSSLFIVFGLVSLGMFDIVIYFFFYYIIISNMSVRFRMHIFVKQPRNCKLER